MSNNDVVQSNVVIGPSPQIEAGFGLRVIVAKHNKFAAATRLYSGTIEEQLAALEADGFSKRGEVYRAIAKTAPMERKSQKVIIGKQAPGTKKVTTLTITAADNFTYSIKGKVDATGIPVTLAEYTSGSAETADEIAAALLVNLNTEMPYSVSVTGAVLEATSEMESDNHFDVSANIVTSVTTPFSTNAQTIDVALDAIRAERPDAYRYELLTLIDSEQDAARAWFDARDLNAWAISGSALNLTGSGQVQKSKIDQSKMNTFVADKYWEFPNVGLDSNRSTFDLDDSNPTYNNVALVGYSVLENDGAALTGAEKEELDSNNAYFLHRVGQASTTWPNGKMNNDSATSNRWTDHQISRDYMQARMQEAQLSLITSEAQKGPGLGFDEASQAMLVLAITAVWNRAAGIGKHVTGQVELTLSLADVDVAGVTKRAIVVAWQGAIGNKISTIQSNGTLLPAV